MNFQNFMSSQLTSWKVYPNLSPRGGRPHFFYPPTDPVFIDTRGWTHKKMSDTVAHLASNEHANEVVDKILANSPIMQHQYVDHPNVDTVVPVPSHHVYVPTFHGVPE